MPHATLPFIGDGFDDQAPVRDFPADRLRVFQSHKEVPMPGWLDRGGSRLQAFLQKRANPLLPLGRRASDILSRADGLMDLDEAGLQSLLSEASAGRRLAPDDKVALDQAMAAAVAAVKKVTGLTPHPEQIMGALALLDGNIAEMATGEGKTLTASMAALVAAWCGRPCHVVTANEYLAKRDAELFAKLFAFCGLSVTHIDGQTPHPSRGAAHGHDVVYTTAKELLGDFLRDALAMGGAPSSSNYILERLRGQAASGTAVAMRGIHQVIVDEADSVLIDEAVTPLIISAQRPDGALEAAALDAVALARQLKQDDHYKINRALRHVELTHAGKDFLAGLTHCFSAFWQSPERSRELVEQALYAMHLLVRDQHYVVREEKVVLVDELTGRLADQRTLSLGMQQVLEASQDLPVSPANEVSARRSFQRFFRLFPRMGGMTGTASEAKAELLAVYRLPTVAIPTHKPVQRKMAPMRIFDHETEKFDAIVAAVLEKLTEGRAVLVGLRSVRSSEALHAHLAKTQPELAARTQLLHAVNHDLESSIVAEAGRAGALTIATNMAGRGTDIGLDESVKAAGGLHVIIGEPNDLARIDRQLVGRCARQGDPGSVQRFACLDDEVFRRFLPAFVQRFWRRLLTTQPGRAQKLGPWFLRLAQKKAESASYRQRQSILEQDLQLDKIGF